MPVLNVRTRGEVAHFSLACGGENHSFRMNVNGEIFDSTHDPDETAVMVALGGRPHICGCAIQAFKAAVISYRSAIGCEDNPAARFRRSTGWLTGEQSCDDCSHMGNTIAHVNSIEHQLASQDLSDFIPMAKTLQRWLHRRGESPKVLKTRYELRQAFPRGHHLSLGNRERQMNLTPEFINLALTIVGDHYHQVEQLRRYGIKVQWLRSLVNNLTDGAKDKIARRNRFSGLHKARNVDPSIVAAFLNEGIYDHIHTYARAHVRPSQVLAVFRKTRGSKTLADFLEEGMTAPQALSSLGIVS